MLVLTNTAGASATTPPASKTTLFVDASGVPSTKSSGGAVTPLLTGPAAAAAYQPLDSDLTGIAGLTYAADKSIYFTGSAWATYDLTGVGRTLLAATTQAAQRTAIQAVGTVGDEDVGGAKRFTAQPNFNMGARISLNQMIVFGDGVGVYGSIRPTGTGTMVIAGGPTGSGPRILLRPQGDAVSTGQAELSASGHFSPGATNAQDVGASSTVWRNAYFQNAPIIGSDYRLKTEPRFLSKAERKAGSELARLPAIWEWLTGDRLHAGPTVQAAMTVMEAHGLDPFAYSFICYDEWEAEPEQWHEWPAKEAVLDDDGNVLEPAVEAGRELIQPAREAGDRYSFRKEELLCFMVSALAAENDLQAAKVEALDARLAALEAKA